MTVDFGSLEYRDDGSVLYRGGFVSCPECGADAELVIWNDGIDVSFECTVDSCGARESIR